MKRFARGVADEPERLRALHESMVADHVETELRIATELASGLELERTALRAYLANGKPARPEPERPEGDAPVPPRTSEPGACPADCICHRIPLVPGDEAARKADGWLTTGELAKRLGTVNHNTIVKRLVSRRSTNRCNHACAKGDCREDAEGLKCRKRKGHWFYFVPTLARSQQ